MSENTITTVNNGEKMSTTKTKYVCVSLPRTGTMSLTQMMKSLGFDVSHAPGAAFEGTLDRADFVSDTPAFQPSKILEVLDRYEDIVFIYINKDMDEWAESMRKVNLVRNYNNMYNTPRADMNVHNLVDFDALYEVLRGEFDEDTATVGFERHKEFILENIPQSKLLIYNFYEGWEPLCKLTGIEYDQSEEVPHLNTNTMFDKLS